MLIVGLVFLHYQKFPDSNVSPFVGVDLAQNPLATFVNSFILFFFFSVVPLLSMVSGWLFFTFDANAAGAGLRHRIGKRFTSLYLPMVCWNALFLLALGALFLLRPHYPLLGELNIRFDRAGAMDYANALFGLTRHPIGFQFWFVRDLFVTALVSPLLWLSLRRAPYLGMAVLGVAWLAGSGLGLFFRTDVAFFFYLGGFLRLRNTPLHIGARTAWAVMALYVALVTLRTLAPWLIDMSGDRPDLITAATRAMRLVGVVACWGVFLQIALTPLGAFVARYGGLAFFLHAAHYPLIAEVKLLLWPLLPAATDGWLVAHLVASVLVTVAIGISLGLVLARGAPKVFALMNGGRSGTGPQNPNVAVATPPLTAAKDSLVGS
nr:acyltransferase family protein [Frateuria defendens]